MTGLRLNARSIAAVALCGLGACVQPAFDRTVVYELQIAGVPDVRSVAVRGDDAPLSWKKDLLLTRATDDSVYRATVTYRTGRLKTEVKFVVNGIFELQELPNRRVAFTGDTTRYRALFDRAVP